MSNITKVTSYPILFTDISSDMIKINNSFRNEIKYLKDDYMKKIINKINGKIKLSNFHKLDEESKYYACFFRNLLTIIFLRKFYIDSLNIKNILWQNKYFLPINDNDTLITKLDKTFKNLSLRYLDNKDDVKKFLNTGTYTINSDDGKIFLNTGTSTINSDDGKIFLNTGTTTINSDEDLSFIYTPNKFDIYQFNEFYNGYVMIKDNLSLAENLDINFYFDPILDDEIYFNNIYNYFERIEYKVYDKNIKLCLPKSLNDENFLSLFYIFFILKINIYTLKNKDDITDYINNLKSQLEKIFTGSNKVGIEHIKTDEIIKAIKFYNDKNQQNEKEMIEIYLNKIQDYENFLNNLKKNKKTTGIRNDKDTIIELNFKFCLILLFKIEGYVCIHSTKFIAYKYDDITKYNEIELELASFEQLCDIYIHLYETKFYKKIKYFERFFKLSEKSINKRHFNSRNILLTILKVVNIQVQLIKNPENDILNILNSKTFELFIHILLKIIIYYILEIIDFNMIYNLEKLFNILYLRDINYLSQLTETEFKRNISHNDYLNNLNFRINSFDFDKSNIFKNFLDSIHDKDMAIKIMNNELEYQIKNYINNYKNSGKFNKIHDLLR